MTWKVKVARVAFALTVVAALAMTSGAMWLNWVDGIAGALEGLL